MYLLIIYLPLISFTICLLLGRKIGVTGSKEISNTCLLICFILSIFMFHECNLGINANVMLMTWFDSGNL